MKILAKMEMERKFVLRKLLEEILNTLALAGKTILVVDDEAYLREVIVFDLEWLGAATLQAANGKEALEILAANPHVSAVISDMRMPEMSGIELVERIRNKNAVSPVVILLTGYTGFPEREALSKGANAILEKPMDRKKMLDLIIRLVGVPADELQDL